jgi:subtilisin family serine protease
MKNGSARKLKLRTRVENKADAANLSWRAKGVTEKQAYASDVYVITLEPEYEITGDDYPRLEADIQRAGAKIIEKHSNKFEDTIVVEFEPKNGTFSKIKALDGIDIISPRPKPRSLFNSTVDGVEGVAYVPSGIACTLAEAKKQANIIDTINGPKSDVVNNGGGTTIIVWDFIPFDVTELQRTELVDRPGGALILFDAEDASRDMHGAAVASTAGGKEVGLASGASLLLMGLTRSISNDLSQIDSICTTTDQPVIVNMSFALEYRNSSTSDRREEAISGMASLTAILEDMTERHPKLLFVVAGGNESLNPCDTPDPVNFGSGENACVDCYMWPQSRLGNPYSTTDLPFLLVGASEYTSTGPNQKISAYSNFGACMHIFGHGTDMCAFNADTGGYTSISGTSFSAPLVSSLAALRFSNTPDATADDVVAYLMSNATDTMTQSGPSQAANTTNKFAETTPAMHEAGASPTAYDGGGGVSISGSLLPMNTDDEASSPKTSLIVAALLAIALLFALGFYFVRSGRNNPIINPF